MSVLKEVQIKDEGNSEEVGINSRWDTMEVIVKGVGLENIIIAP